MTKTDRCCGFHDARGDVRMSCRTLANGQHLLRKDGEAGRRYNPFTIAEPDPRPMAERMAGPITDPHIVAECWTCDPPTRRNAGRCRRFLRRVRPQGYNIVCEAPATRETWAYGPNGEMIYHGHWCTKHTDTARYSTTLPGWHIAFEDVSMERHRAAGHDVREVSR